MPNNRGNSIKNVIFPVVNLRGLAGNFCCSSVNVLKD
jgi:hypothetical protein